MARQNLMRRLNQVERILAPPQRLRFIVKFEGPGSEHFPQPTEEEIKENKVYVVRFLAARDGPHTELPAQEG